MRIWCEQRLTLTFRGLAVKTSSGTLQAMSALGCSLTCTSAGVAPPCRSPCSGSCMVDEVLLLLLSSDVTRSEGARSGGLRSCHAGPARAHRSGAALRATGLEDAHHHAPARGVSAAHASMFCTTTPPHTVVVCV